MIRKYKDLGIKKSARIICLDIIRTGKSENWSGSIRLLEKMKIELLKFSVNYAPENNGKWEPASRIKKREIMDKLIVQIKQDIAIGDVTALEELLLCVPLENLNAYLREEI